MYLIPLPLPQKEFNMIHTQDMSQVADTGEVQDPGNYLVRVSEVRETNSDGTQLMSESGGEKVIFLLKIQDEGKWLGSQLQIHASLQPHALFNLKAIYNAAGYKPGPEGHDPQEVLDSEFYVYVRHREYEDRQSGQKRTGTDIPPWGIRSIAQGPAKPRV
jgi:hypothetical protein